MYDVLKRNWDKTKYLILSGFAVIFLLLVTVVYKNDSEIKDVATEGVFKEKDLVSLKEFFLTN